MQRLKDYDVRFSGLKLGEHSFEYQLDNGFFALFGYTDFERSNLKGKLKLTKKENALELEFKVKGSVSVPCDITGDPFDLPVKNKMQVMVKFGAGYDDSDEEVLVLPMAEHTANVAQYFYEATVLAVPLKRVRPDLEESEMGQEILARLEQLGPENNRPTESGEEEMDPRWDKLKDLLN